MATAWKCSPWSFGGTYFALGATGFIVGGALIGKFGLGSNSLRTMLIAVALMGVLGARLAPLLGEGTSRGVALVFLIAGIMLIAAALLAFLTPVYRRVSASYLEASA